MDSSTFTRARYPAIIPHDLARAEPVTIQKPRTALSFAQLAAMEQQARWQHDGRQRQHYAPHNLGQRATQETLDGWLAELATLPAQFIALDAQNAMGCAKSATHNRLHMLADKGMVQKVRTRSGPQLWEVTPSAINAKETK
jgi:prophage DNA circulation protein